MGGNEGEGVRVFLVVPRDRAGGNGSKLKYAQFTHKNCLSPILLRRSHGTLHLGCPLSFLLPYTYRQTSKCSQ